MICFFTYFVCLLTFCSFFPLEKMGLTCYYIFEAILFNFIYFFVPINNFPLFNLIFFFFVIITVFCSYVFCIQFFLGFSFCPELFFSFLGSVEHLVVILDNIDEPIHGYRDWYNTYNVFIGTDRHILTSR